MYLDIDPSFQGAWGDFLVEWEDYEEEGGDTDLPIYLVLSDLARHLIAMLAKGETDKFRQIFQLVDRWCLEGEHYVQEAAVVGLLEDLQNEGLHSTTKPSGFEPWLLSESKYWWDKVAAFWEKGELIVDDRPAK
ncbi:DUF7674 family protein [Alterisphingorhabdus coralli]|uniref:DUF7674 domain-containing protein n=1 Tax=Alterisphingorhabdus coralli TaxID=3071408 RepID=A0AA97F6S5_9SPHN|nr:hypothetical protein [Parasphingorhabdus sp. SCSIO 66989]WOE75414.1 hypothetical protein RB602_01480 [Parasphingorhabdus sp. SCSIO 66989]